MIRSGYNDLSKYKCWKLFDGLNKNRNKPNDPVATVPQKDVIILGLHSNHFTKRLKSCVNRFYSFVNVKVIFQNKRRIKSFFPFKDRFNRSQLSIVIYKASCWDCNDFYIGKTKRRLHDPKMEHFKALLITLLLLVITLKKPVTTSNGTILTFWHLARLTTIVRLKRPYLFEICNQHSQTR